jgi:hypothetical protein
MNKIVGSYSERTYAEITGVPKPKPPKLPKKMDNGLMQLAPSLDFTDENNFII